MALKIKGAPLSTPLPVENVVLGVDYGVHLQTKPVAGMVTIQKSVGGKEIPGGVSETQTLSQGVFGTGMSITVEGGRTLNLGNFESARVGVTITVPCDQGTLEEAYDYATTWVSGKIEEAVKDAKNG